MRIAQIAPLAESVPPRLYGGTERIVSYLTEELVRRGHEVTLFASGDSSTAARLVRCSPMALRLDEAVADALPHHMLMLDQLRQRHRQFDVLHFHTEIMQFPLLRLLSTPAVTTLHGRLDLPDLQPFYRRFPDLALVSISKSQREPLPPVRWMRTIHHGLPRSLLSFNPRPEGYLAFLGRISPEKRPDRAIEIASRAGLPLKIAAKVDKADSEYWREVVEPMVRRTPLVEYIGEISEGEKAEFLGNASALVFPIDWPEPFGLAMIKSMACGTPVIAFRCGSVPEVVDPGLTGFIVSSIEEAVAAAGHLEVLDRAMVRSTFERRFSVERMVGEYEEVYQELCSDTSAFPAGDDTVIPLTAVTGH